MAWPHEVAVELADLAEAADGRRVILGVERLDYTKGIPERLLASRALLTDKPELAEQVVFFQIAVPSRTDVDDYTLRELEQTPQAATPSAALTALLERLARPIHEASSETA